MDKQDLVKRLQGWVNSHGVGSYGSIGADLVADAIAYINEAPSRDEVLSKVAAMCILRADELTDTRSAYDAVAGAELMAMADRIRALKSTPAPQAEQKIVVGMERGVGGKSPTFTRTDGTTSPVKVHSRE